MFGAAVFLFASVDTLLTTLSVSGLLLAPGADRMAVPVLPFDCVPGPDLLAPYPDPEPRLWSLSSYPR